MARTTVDSNGLAAATPISLSANATDVSEYDVFVSNQGEGAMRVTLTWTEADFTAVFIPPQAHRPRVDLTPGDVVFLDTNQVKQLVAFRPVDSASGSSDLTFTGQKTHVTAASTGNDFMAIGSGLR